MRDGVRTWIRRLLLLAIVGVGLILFVGLPLGGSFLMTNSRFSFPERGPHDPSELEFEVTPVSFVSADGVRLKGWWNAGERERPIIVFVHGLNRSRLELLTRAAESRQRGYGTLLFDLRNHGESGRAYTTLGVHESRDVCAAEQFARSAAPGRPIILWGVSLGASTALLSLNACESPMGIVADSSFLSFEETIAHHFELITPFPSFPIADLLIAVTRRRMGFTLEEGDVELAVRNHPDVAVLFVAGDADQRMLPELARRLRRASAHPQSELLIVEGASHGRAFDRSPELYTRTVFDFLRRLSSGTSSPISDTMSP